ncbi:MAG: major facilitator superfamily domain-containing protein 6 [Parvularculaceae bacterium]
MSPYVRFGLFYTAVFLLLGVQLPFFPVWLESRGLSEIVIGATLAAAFSGRAVFSVAAAYLVDRRLEQRRALGLIGAGTAAAFAIAGLASHTAVLIAFSILAVWLYGTAIPLSDVAAAQAEKRGLLHYGRARAVGSAAFILANLGGGLAVGRFGAEAVIWWIVAAGAAMAATAPLLPQAIPETGDAKDGVALRAVARLLCQRRFLVFLLGVSAVQASHAVYYTFSAIEWSRQGRSDLLIGVLWASGIVVEIIFFSFSARLTRHFSPAAMLALGAGGAAARWTATALNPPLAILFPAQALHALTFGATHLATVYFVREHVPASLANTAMTVSSSLAIGMAAGLAAFAAAPIYKSFGALAFLSMSLLGVIGLIAAVALLRGAGGRRASAPQR